MKARESMGPNGNFPWLRIPQLRAKAAQCPALSWATGSQTPTPGRTSVEVVARWPGLHLEQTALIRVLYAARWGGWCARSCGGGHGVCGGARHDVALSGVFPGAQRSKLPSSRRRSPCSTRMATVPLPPRSWEL